jgi:hypothetical protein
MGVKRTWRLRCDVWPPVARAQQTERRIGVLMLYPRTKRKGQLRATAFRQQICGTSGDYGSNNADLFRQVGNYTGRILKGENRPTFLLSKPRSLR